MSWKRSFIHVALAVSVCANVWLVQRVTALEKTFSALTARPRLEVGSRLPELHLQTAAGTPVGVRYRDSQHATVLYVLSPSCSWCTKNADSVAALAKLTENRTRWVGISLSPRSQKLSEKSMSEVLTNPQTPFPIYTGLQDAAAKSLRLRSTPTTIVVSPEGAVLVLWEGAYSGKIKGEVEAYFKVTLPGLAGQVTATGTGGRGGK